MIAPISSAPVVTTRGIILGIICRLKIVAVDAPIITAAVTYSSPRTFNVIERTRRAYFAQPTTDKAKIVFTMLPPKIPAIAMAKTTPGKDNIISARRMRTISTLPPK